MPPRRAARPEEIPEEERLPPGHFVNALEGARRSGQHAAASAWMTSTLTGYSSGMSKYIEFKEKTASGFDPSAKITDNEIYNFIAWAGKSLVDNPSGPKNAISSATIKNYLNGIRAWHIVRHTRIPRTDQEVVKVLLRATKRNKEEKSLVTVKKPVMVQQLFDLLKNSTGKSARHDLATTVALVAFWGMARLGELLRGSKESGALLVRHLEFGSTDGQKYAKLHLQKAKTAKPGEIQVIHLQEQRNVLDPVSALERLLAGRSNVDRDDFLFALEESGGVSPMLKRAFTNTVEECWGHSRIETWTGHSFRVGGTSIRFNLGTPMKVKVKQGRWKSLTYLRYFKAYSSEQTRDTISFLEAIEEEPEEQRTGTRRTR